MIPHELWHMDQSKDTYFGPYHRASYSSLLNIWNKKISNYESWFYSIRDLALWFYEKDSAIGIKQKSGKNENKISRI